jgi:hypothetical protein
MQRVRLQAGRLREVDGPLAAQAARGEARRQAWPAAGGAAPRTETGVSYTPGRMRGLAAGEIGALLLPGGIGERHERSAINDSLMEDMLHKAASAASPGQFNGVPWDSSDNNASARDYLRSVMSDMNRDVVVADPLDIDIQQILDDPDAFIARTAATGSPHVSRAHSTQPAHAQPEKAAAGAVAHPPSEKRTRRLVQGTTFRDATGVGRSDISGLPTPAAGQEPWNTDAHTVINEGAPQQSRIGPGDTESRDRPDHSSTDGFARASTRAAETHIDEDVPLEEMVDKKEGQQREMQALCERLQTLVASAKELAKTSAAGSKGGEPAIAQHPAAAATHPPAMGSTLARTGGVNVRAQTAGSKNFGWAQPWAGGAFGSECRDGKQESSDGKHTRRGDKQESSDDTQLDRRPGAGVRRGKSRGAAHPWLEVRGADDNTGVEEDDAHEDAAASSSPPQERGECKSAAGDEQTASRSPAPALKTVRSPVAGAKSAQIAATEMEGASAGQVGRVLSSGKKGDSRLDAAKGPVCVGRKVNPMAGRKQHKPKGEEGGASSAEILRALMSKLAGAWKNVGAIFNHFDRPDVEEDGEHKGDSEISLEEFVRGVRDLKLEFSDEQIEEVFHVVDKDGSGSIDHSELEEVLRDCGVLKSVSVKRVLLLLL